MLQQRKEMKFVRFFTDKIMKQYCQKDKYITIYNQGDGFNIPNILKIFDLFSLSIRKTKFDYIEKM